MPFTLRAGRMISGSKISPKGEVCVWNANLCTKSKGKFWFGDLNLTHDLEQLQQAAFEQGESVYILRERDARFQSEANPRFENAVAKVEPSGHLYMLNPQ